MFRYIYTLSTSIVSIYHYIHKLHPLIHTLLSIISTQGEDRRGVKLSSRFSRVAQLEINIEEEGARLRSDFSTFVASVIAGMSKNRDQEEISILNSR